MDSLILAVDGGGTKCKASLFNQAGNVLASAISGPANVFSDLNQACCSIVEAANECLKQVNQCFKANPIQLNDLLLSAGCAGAGISQAAVAFDAWQSPFKHKLLTSDLHISCLSSNNGEDCVLAILGTGSSFAVLKEGSCCQYGGHGFVLGDHASGAYLGKRALQVCLTYFERSKTSSVKIESDKAVERFVNSISRIANVRGTQTIVEQYAKASPNIFAKLAPKIFELAQQHNETAIELINESCKYVVDMFRVIGQGEELPCYLTGGLSQSYLPYLENQNNFKPHISSNAAEYGAYLHACAYLKESDNANR
jgi:glucosamine kinase